MPLTLREALNTIEPLRQSRVVAGERGLDNIVQFVNVMEVPDIVQWVHPGELLVTTLYPLRDRAAEIEYLIPRLHEKQLAGLAVNPLAYINEFPRCMIDAANELGFPLIQLPHNVSFIDIIQPLTSKLLALQANELIQSGNIHRQFIDLVLSGGGYSDIAQGIAQLVKHPVSIVDRFRRVLGNGFVIDQMRLPKLFVRDEPGGDSYISDRYKPEVVSQLPGSTAKRMVAKSPEGDIEHIVCPVKVGAMVLGQIIVWGALVLPQSSVELMAIEHGSTVTALKMMERRSTEGVEQRFRKETLDGLLSKEPSARERAIVLARDLGLRLNPPYAVILVGPDLPPGTLLPRAEQMEQSQFDTSLHLAMRYLRARRPDAVFWYEGPRLVIFYPLQTHELSGARHALTLDLGDICKRIAQENAPYTVSMGISSAGDQLEDFRQSYDCARQSLQIGRIFRHEPCAVATHYEDLGIFRIVSLAESPASIERFCQDTIGTVLAYDKQNGTQLTETLRVFLEQNQNLAQAAKVLNIHYNTLRYRLDRIRELLGDALDHPHQRLTVEVALHLQSLISNS
ncbi:MAG: PucR family transcriptional regulator ligand-binding domain-containing protein [Chloroflexi bacterium]|nr:PucR family transcriptional regulator ligand-binding domain-containing protein [Chloroflexota bacterium]